MINGQNQSMIFLPAPNVIPSLNAVDIPFGASYFAKWHIPLPKKIYRRLGIQS